MRISEGEVDRVLTKKDQGFLQSDQMAYFGRRRIAAIRFPNHRKLFPGRFLEKIQAPNQELVIIRQHVIHIGIESNSHI